MKDLLFTLRIKINDGSMLTALAYDGGMNGSHNRIDMEVKHKGKAIFPFGSLHCGLPGGMAIDGIHAKELVLSTVQMKPGDTDSEYFDSYTPEQLEFANQYGEELSMIREQRYCDRNGNVRRGYP